MSEPKEAGDVEEVTFLYRLTDGACPKSYGANVARLAGLPDVVVRRAAAKAQESEEARQACGAGGAPSAEGMDVDGAVVEEEEAAAELLRRVQAACKAAAAGGGGDAAAAAAVLQLQHEVRQLLRIA